MERDGVEQVVTGGVGYKYVQNTLYEILKDQKILLFVKENTNYIYLDLGHIGNISSKCVVVLWFVSWKNRCLVSILDQVSMSKGGT